MATERMRSYQHQTDARRKSRHRAAFAFLMEMGTGKSKVIVDEFSELYEEGLIDRVLVVTAKGNYANWTNKELPEHMPEEIFWDSLLWANDQTIDSRRRMAEFMGGEPCLRVLVVNIEALAAVARCREFCLRFVEGGRAYMVVDESNIIGNWESRSCREATALGARCRYRRIATGTPAPTNPESLYGQFQFLDPSLLGFSTIYGFRKRHAVMSDIKVGNRTIRRPFAYVHMDELADKVALHSHRVLKDDCLDLPPKIYMPLRPVQLSSEQERLYRQMARQQVAVLDAEGALVTAEMVIVQVMRLQQILCGHVRADDGTIHELPQSRVQAVLDIIEESGSRSAIVWCAYRQDVVMLQRELARAHGADQVLEFHGGVREEDRVRATRRFQDRSARFMLATSAGARGMTWTAADLCVYYSNQRQLLIRLQSEDRAHRAGLQHAVTYVDLVCPGLVDERIVRSYREKIDLAAAITRDGHRRWVV